MSLYPLRTWLTFSPPATRNHRKVQGLRNETFKWTDHSLLSLQICCDVQNVPWIILWKTLSRQRICFIHGLTAASLMDEALVASSLFTHSC